VVGAVAGPALVAFLPVPVVGALLAMLGFSFVVDWVVGGHRRMALVEYLLMLIIVIALVVLGFLFGVLYGMAAAVLLFTVTYSQLDPIRHSFTGADRASSVERSSAVRRRLIEIGATVQIVALQGFLFFGTAHSVVASMRELLDSAATRALIVDLRRVEGMDSTASVTLAKLMRELLESGIALVISHASEEAESGLTRAGVEEGPGVAFVSDIDHALEWCEELLLAEAPDEGTNPWLLPDSLRQRVVPHLDRIVVDEHGVIAEFGEDARCVFIVESGRVAAEIPVGDHRWQRVLSAGPGGVLGELSMYGAGPRSARLRAEEAGVVLRLSPEAVTEMERTDPQCAIAFHRALAGVLSDRLVGSNDFIRALAR
jgi:sulfate permease, SulP family